MANWTGAARSNYVLIKDVAALRAALEPFPIEVHKKYEDDSDNNCLVCLLSNELDNGGWPTYGHDEDDNEIEFDPTQLVCPHMVEGQILVMMETGNEKLRYLSGTAQAFNHQGTSISVRLDDIYFKAAEFFGVPQKDITTATY